MSKKSSRSNHKVYKMRGCSKKTRKNHLGGSSDVPLAYTGKPVFSVPNPNLAYTAKGGASSDMLPKSNIPINTNASNPAYPNTGPVPKGNIIFNSVMPQHGGSCSSCSVPLMSGGGCGCGLPIMNGGRKSRKNKKASNKSGFMIGGKIIHRPKCKCNDCRKIMAYRNMKGGNPGKPYPGGLTGSAWGPNPSEWPGVNHIAGDRNHYPLNTFKDGDPPTSMVDVGANPPFLNIKGGKRKQKGGTLSNFIGQDLINLGRQFQYGLGSAYNALAGYASPVNPMPWKGQFPVGAPMNPVKPIV